MKEKICHWLKDEKFKLLLVLLAFVNIFALIPTYTFEKWVNTAFLVVGVVVPIVLIIRDTKRTQKISKVYLIGINAISMINFLLSGDIEFPMCLLLIRAPIFLAVVVLGLVVAWQAKIKFAKKFIPYLIISLLTVILNFGGFYDVLYSMYFPYGQESLKIEQGMSYSQAIMPIDFVYYSGDAFFGTDISGVRINYIDYMKWYDKDSMEARYVDKYTDALIVVQVSKLFSFLESLLFIVYISLIVMGSEGVQTKKGCLETQTLLKLENSEYLLEYTLTKVTKK